MKESKFQADTLKEIKGRMPDGTIILKNNPCYKQGISDIAIMGSTPNDEPRWALLEFKDEEDADHQANQDDYVEIADLQSFGRFIYPENKEEVLDELYTFFGV